MLCSSLPDVLVGTFPLKTDFASRIYMHVPSIETHGVSTSAVLTITSLSFTRNTVLWFFQLLYPFTLQVYPTSITKHNSHVFNVSVGVWTQVFRLLTTSSSQRPLGYSRARRWCAVFLPRLLSSNARFSGPSLAPKPSCRGAVRTQLLAGPSGTARLRCGSMVQSRVRQRTANERPSGDVSANVWIVAKRRSDSVIRST